VWVYFVAESLLRIRLSFLELIDFDRAIDAHPDIRIARIYPNFTTYLHLTLINFGTTMLALKRLTNIFCATTLATAFVGISAYCSEAAIVTGSVTGTLDQVSYLYGPPSSYPSTPFNFIYSYDDTQWISSDSTYSGYKRIRHRVSLLDFTLDLGPFGHVTLNGYPSYYGKPYIEMEDTYAFDAPIFVFPNEFYREFYFGWLFINWPVGSF
jgi:hypothetical protein